MYRLQRYSNKHTLPAAHVQKFQLRDNLLSHLITSHIVKHPHGTFAHRLHPPRLEQTLWNNFSRTDTQTVGMSQAVGWFKLWDIIVSRQDMPIEIWKSLRHGHCRYVYIHIILRTTEASSRTAYARIAFSLNISSTQRPHPTVNIFGYHIIQKTHTDSHPTLSSRCPTIPILRPAPSSSRSISTRQLTSPRFSAPSAANAALGIRMRSSRSRDILSANACLAAHVCSSGSVQAARPQTRAPAVELCSSIPRVRTKKTVT
jgi:hypothetical protein